MSRTWLRRAVRTRISCTSSPLERAAGGGWRARLERVLSSRCPAEVVLDRQQVVLAPLDDCEELCHRGDLLALLLQEPVEELLPDELTFVTRELHELDDLLGHPLLLRERQRDGR